MMGNDACRGYMIMAMERVGFLASDIRKALESIEECFDDTTVEEAADLWIRW